MAFKHLKDEIAELFAELSQRVDESNEAWLERRSWTLKRNAQRMAVWRALHPKEYAEELRKGAQRRKAKLASDPEARQRKRDSHKAYLKRRRIREKASRPESSRGLPEAVLEAIYASTESPTALARKLGISRHAVNYYRRKIS